MYCRLLFRAVAPFLCLAAAAPAFAEPASLDVGSERVLFLDDWCVEKSTGLKRVLHQPKKEGLIKDAAGKDWDRGDCYWSEGNIVCRDNAGRFHMTYRYMWWDPEVSKQPTIGQDKAHWFRQTVAYAYSDDGIHWHKPKLGLIDAPSAYRKQRDFPYEVPAAMSKDNNVGCPIDFIVDLGERGNVADPKKRFLLRVVKKDDTHPFAKIIESGLYFAADWPDFAHDPKWKEKLTPIPQGRLSPRGFRTIAGYDHQAKVWFQVCQDYLGNWIPRGGRDIARFTSPDLIKWQGPELVLPIAKDENQKPTDWTEYMMLDAYRVGGPRAGVWLGQLSIFPSDRSDPQFQMPGQAKVWRKGPVELRLVLSRDAGKTWQRVGGREVWLPHHREEHGYDYLVFGAQPVRVKDELWCYYSAWDGEHLIFNRDGSMYKPGFARTGRTARATLRFDGYVSLDAGDKEGEILTKPMRWEGTRLAVNVSAPKGQLRCEIQDENGKPIEGFMLADSLPTTGDCVSSPMRWRKHEDLRGLAGRTVRVRLTLRDAALYGFQFKE